MKAKLVETILKEGVSKDQLNVILKLIGEAHDKIMEAQDELDTLSYEYDDEILDCLSYDLSDLESSLSELDFVGSDNPTQDAYDHYDIEVEKEYPFTLYAYDDEDGNVLAEIKGFDTESEATKYADSIVDKYTRVEILDINGEKIY